MIHIKAQRINKEIEIPKKSTNGFHYKFNIKETQSILWASLFKNYYSTWSGGSSTQTRGSQALVSVSITQRPARVQVPGPCITQRLARVQVPGPCSQTLNSSLSLMNLHFKTRSSVLDSGCTRNVVWAENLSLQDKISFCKSLGFCLFSTF